VETEAVAAAERPTPWYGDPSSLTTALVGALLGSLGAMAVVRAGFEPPLTKNVVLVAGFLHTALLGVIEVLLGGLLIAAATSRSRNGAMGVGAVVAALSTAAALGSDTLGRPLAIEERYAWLLVMVSLIVVSVNLAASDAPAE
jgi:hypothetical protein